MAAFEAISTLAMKSISGTETIDLRTARLPSETNSDDSRFDPRDHRTPKKPIQLWMAYFNILRAGFGAGMLGLPLAISQAGFVLGPLLLLCTGLLLVHTHRTLLWCLNEISRQLRIPYVSYRYGFRMALLRGPPICHSMGKCGPTIITTFMLLSQTGICTVFVIFTSDSLRDIADWPSSKPAMACLILPYLILELTIARSLSLVSYVSLIGNVLNTLGMLLVFYSMFKEPHGELMHATTEPLPFLFAFGTMLFNGSMVAVILSLDKALAEPRALTKRFGVVPVGLLVPTFVGIIFGTFGYYAFGTMEENILRSLPYDDDTSMVAIGFYLIAVGLTYPIQCFPVIGIIQEVIKNHDKRLTPSDRTLDIIGVVIKPIFVGLTFLICYWIPFQGPFVAFVGNLCTTFLVLIFPALMELCLRYPYNYGKYSFYLIKNILIMVLGLTSFIFGAVLSGYLIYARLLSKESPNDSNFF